jgi:transposase
MKRSSMRKIRAVLRQSAEGMSTRQIAASLAIGRTTLQGYLDRARDAEWSGRCRQTCLTPTLSG